jgi:hypothetical protein
LHDLDSCDVRGLRATAASLANETLAVLGTADQATATTWRDYWFAYLVAPPTTNLSLSITVVNNHGRVEAQAASSNGGTMATAMTMDDTLTVAAQPEDDHGDVTGDQLAWTATDGGTVLTLVVSADTQSVTATPVAEGSSTITVSDPTAPGVTGSVDVTVGPGPTSQIVVTPTVNTGANVVPPAG